MRESKLGVPTVPSGSERRRALAESSASSRGSNNNVAQQLPPQPQVRPVQNYQPCSTPSSGPGAIMIIPVMALIALVCLAGYMIINSDIDKDLPTSISTTDPVVSPTIVVQPALPKIGIDPKWSPRKVAQHQWFEAAKSVSVLDKELYDIVQAAEPRMVAATPLPFPIKLEVVEGTPVDNWIAIVPLQMGDKQRGTKWEEQFGDGFAASESPLGNDRYMIVLRDYLEWTEFWKGLTTCHELIHIDDVKQLPIFLTPTEWYARSERRAKEGGIRLCVAKGGPDFVATCKEEAMTNFLPVFKSSGLNGLANMKFLVPKSEQALAKIIGKHGSPTELSMRYTYIGLYCVELIIEQEYPRDQWESVKTEFFRRWLS